MAERPAMENWRRRPGEWLWGLMDCWEEGGMSWSLLRFFLGVSLFFLSEAILADWLRAVFITTDKQPEEVTSLRIYLTSIPYLTYFILFLFVAHTSDK